MKLIELIVTFYKVRVFKIKVMSLRDDSNVLTLLFYIIV